MYLLSITTVLSFLTPIGTVCEMNMRPLLEAIKIAGSQSKLAAQIGVGQSHISNWLHRDKRVPAEQVLKIERATGISRHALRPDIYPTDTTQIEARAPC